MTATTASSEFSGTLRLLTMTGLRWLVIGHRWLGIVACLFCAMWFVSGVVMMYVPYPTLTASDRMAYSAPLDWKAVKLTPEQALKAAKAKAFPAQFRLNMLGEEPVYRIAAGRRRTAVSAVDGRTIEGFSPAQAAALVQKLLPGRTLGPVQTITRDFWTVTQTYDGLRPLYKVPVKGPEGLVLYVSSKSGEVVNDTRRAERAWNYVGSVIHWLYPTGARALPKVWHHLIVWTSGAALVVAVSGIWLGIVRLRLKRRPGQPVSPYRGWMKWHHWAGLIGGVVVVTWLVSGALSVHPFGILGRSGGAQPRTAAYAGERSARFETNLGVIGAMPAGAHEARFAWIAGRPLIFAMDGAAKESAFDARTGVRPAPTDDELFARARGLMPDAPVAFTTRLTQPDDYWYSYRNSRRLPVLRIGFDDKAHSWFHIAPDTGEILGRSDDTSRAYRWWFNMLHDFDLPFLLRRRPLWDIVMWTLSAAGLLISVSGVVIGWRRLKLKAGIRPKTKRAPARRASTKEAKEIHA